MRRRKSSLSLMSLRDPEVEAEGGEAAADPQAPLQPDLGQDDLQPDVDAVQDDQDDQMARDRTKSGRAEAKKQLEAIIKSNNQMENMSKSKLSTFDLDNLAKALSFNIQWGRVCLPTFLLFHQVRMLNVNVSQTSFKLTQHISNI